MHDLDSKHSTVSSKHLDCKFDFGLEAFDCKFEVNSIIDSKHSILDSKHSIVNSILDSNVNSK